MNPDEAELLAAVRPQRKRKRKKKAKPGDAPEDAGIVLQMHTQKGKILIVPLHMLPVAYKKGSDMKTYGTFLALEEALEEDEEGEAKDPYAADDAIVAEYKRKHRNMRKNWELPSSFPDARVIEAYRKAGLHRWTISNFKAY